MFTFNVQPGIITAIFFIIFDVITLSLVDMTLSRLACEMYYRRVMRGETMVLKSADIPGVTSYLVGRRLDITNISILLVKLIFLAVVFQVNLDIESIPQQVSTTHSFGFNGSAARLGDDTTLTRKFTEMRRCSRWIGNNVTYYRLAFNLLDGAKVAENPEFFLKFSSHYHVNESTLHCVSPQYVSEKDAQTVAKVVGCSKFKARDCSDTSVANLSVNANALKPIMTYISSPPTRNPMESIKFRIFEYADSDVRSIWTDYENPSLTCSDNNSTRANETSSSTIRFTYYCLLTAQSSTHTLVERWVMTGNNTDVQLMRMYPGPIFEGSFEIGRAERAGTLVHIILPVNWQGLSAIVVTHALVFEERQLTFSVKTGDPLTVLPQQSFICAVVAFVLSLVGTVVIWLVGRRDTRPRFNTLDGVSSMLREEHNPKGKSFVRGSPACVAQYLGKGELLQFGVVSERCNRVLPTRKECLDISDSFVSVPPSDTDTSTSCNSHTWQWKTVVLVSTPSRGLFWLVGHLELLLSVSKSLSNVSCTTYKASPIFGGTNQQSQYKSLCDCDELVLNREPSAYFKMTIVSDNEVTDMFIPPVFKPMTQYCTHSLQCASLKFTTSFIFLFYFIKKKCFLK